MENINTYMRHYRRGTALLAVGLCVGLVVVTAAAMASWQRRQQAREVHAQHEMYQAVYLFEEENFSSALHGSPRCTGLLDIIKQHSTTKSANLARLYAGVCYMNERDYASALQHLKQFQAKDYLLQARAWALIGDAYAEQGDHAQAAVYYVKAADYRPNAFFTPLYLASAAMAYEAKQQYKAACECYEKIVKNYPDAIEYEEARKHVHRLSRWV